MLLKSDAAQPALQEHVNTFVKSFFVNGARNHIRKTTKDAPWLNVGITEKTNPELFYSSSIFAGLNIIGGNAYSLGHGFIHGYLNGSAEDQIKRAVANLNSLGADEIIFYHDESQRGLELAREMGLEFQFKPVSLLEWLVRQVKENQEKIRPLDLDVALQIPCSWHSTDKNNSTIEELFDLIGVRRVTRQYDRENRICCGIRGYFGLITGDTLNDSDLSANHVRKNVEDAKLAGAEYMITTCPYCYAGIAAAAQNAEIKPLQVEGLVSLALHNESLPDGLTFL